MNVRRLRQRKTNLTWLAGLRTAFADLRSTIDSRSGDSAQTDRHKGPPLQLSVWTSGIMRLLGLIVSALFAVDLVTQVVAELRIVDPDAMGIKQILRMLDLGAESSFGTWYQVMALAFLSLIVAGIGLAKRRTGDRFTRHWFLLAFLALGFSLDEQVTLHDPGGGTETIREDLGLSGPIFYGWVIFGTLSILAVWFIYRRFLADLPQTTRRLYTLAAALFVGGEIVMESFAGWYADMADSETDLIYQTLTSFEEFFGMAGIFVAIAASLQYAQIHYGEVRVALHVSANLERTSQSLPNPRSVIVPITTPNLGMQDAMEATNGSAAGASQPATR